MPTRQIATRNAGHRNSERVGHRRQPCRRQQRRDVGVEQRRDSRRAPGSAPTEAASTTTALPVRCATKAASVSGSCGWRTMMRAPRALHRADQRGEMRGRRRHAGLRLDEADEIEPEAAGEIGPGVVIGDERHAAQRRELRLPFLELAVEAREEGQPVGLVGRRVGRIDARQRLEDVAGDDLGILRIEPVVRIAAAVGMAVAGADAQRRARRAPRCANDAST